jgi:uncharacterized protein
VSRRDLWVDTVELRRHTGDRRGFAASAALGELAVGDVALVGGRVDVDLVIEAVTEGVVVTGTARARWEGPCRRCLEPTGGELMVDVHEVFEVDPTEGETWLLEEEGIDLAPMLRETALLALPLSPLCREECAGPEPERFPTGPAAEEPTAADPTVAGPPKDPRWAALDQMSFEEESAAATGDDGGGVEGSRR